MLCKLVTPPYCVASARSWDFELAPTVSFGDCNIDLNWQVTELWTPLTPITVDSLIEIVRRKLSTTDSGG
jgi:hypothetical protein